MVRSTSWTDQDSWTTFPELWNAVVASRGTELALVCDDVRLAFDEIDQRSRLLAKGLIAIGCTKGSHVALLHPNSAEFIICFVAATRIGATVLPLSTLSTASEIAWLVSSSDTQVLFATREFRGRNFIDLLRKGIEGLDLSGALPLRLPATPWLRHVYFGGEGNAEHGPGFGIEALEAKAGAVNDAMLIATERSVRPSDWLAIVHTSGSTSHPKGVIHAHGPLLHHLQNINAIREFGPQEILFSTSPWFWIAGLAYALIANLIAGARMVISNEADPAKVLDVIERERPTITQGHFSTVRRLAADPSFPDRDLTSIRRGNLYPISPPDIRPADQELRHNIYGMTEAGGALTMNPDESDQPKHRRGTCGNFLPGFEWRIVDPDTGTDVQTGEAGELWIRGPLMMVGYYGKPRSEVFDADGWWRSDDIGRVDEDGIFYPVGRLSDIIKTSGANVAPEEVAAVLRRLTQRDCVVLSLPDAERGEIVAAVVVGEEPVDTADLQLRARAILSSYKVPRFVCAMVPGDVPTLSSGKIDKHTLREMVMRERARRSSKTGKLQ